jgi:type IV pilus assembly protein PilC
LQRLTHRDILFFFRQLATLMMAGISLLTACDVLYAAQSNTALRLLIYKIKRELLLGKSLSLALQTTPLLFDAFTITLIQLSEHTGQLAGMLNLIADYLEKKAQFKKRLLQLLFYPGIVCCAASLMMMFMLIFVVPRFAVLFQTLTTPLPVITRVIFGLSFFLLHHALCISLIALLLMMACYYSLKKIKLNYWLQKVKKIPLLSYYHHQLTLLQFVRNTALTLNAGLPLTKSIQLAANTTNDTAFIAHTKHIQTNLERGQALHASLKQTHYFPPLFIELVKTGEESGMLTAMLNKMADLLESDLNQLNQRLQTLLEPLIILVLGALIGGLVIGMYLPIFKLGSAF